MLSIRAIESFSGYWVWLSSTRAQGPLSNPIALCSHDWRSRMGSEKVALSAFQTGQSATSAAIATNRDIRWERDSSLAAPHVQGMFVIHCYSTPCAPFYVCTCSSAPRLCARWSTVSWTPAQAAAMSAFAGQHSGDVLRLSAFSPSRGVSLL